jgi:hypothetical protein
MAHSRRSKSVQLLVAAFVERLTLAIDQQIDIRARALAADWIEAITVLEARSRRPFGPTGPATTERSGRRPAFRPLPSPEPANGTLEREMSPRPPPASGRDSLPPTRGRRASREVAPNRSADPGQDRRDAELGRLRRLLRPTISEDVPGVLPAGVVPATPSVLAASARTDSSRDPLRLLEDDIRERFPSLARLPPAAAAARIGAWAGRARRYEEESGNKMAANLLLDKLRVLAHTMDVGRIEALNASWRTKNWPAYIEQNELLAEARPTPEQQPPSPSTTTQRMGEEAGYDATWSE